MKLQVLQENLSKAVSTAARFASSKAQLPVLGNIHLKTYKNKLIINATNLEVSISQSLGSQISEAGELTVPAKTFNEIIGNLPRKPIDLEVDKEQLKISTENFSSTIAGMNASDFPKIPESVDTSSHLPKDILIDALSKILFSVSIDESRPAITGVLFIFEENNLTLVATDGFRLSRKKIEAKGNEAGTRVIVPKNILAELTRLPAGTDDIVYDYKKEDNQIVFGYPGTVISSRTIALDFPPFEKIIPKHSDFFVRVDSEELLRYVKLSSIFARDSANVVKFNFTKKGINILAESKMSGSQKSFVEARVDGEISEDPIAFNFRFVEDLLGILEGEEVEMSFSGSDAPGVFYDPKDKNFLHLIMPVKIQD